MNFKKGETVLICTDGTLEAATFVKISGSGNPVVQIANGQTISLQAPDVIAKRFVLNAPYDSLIAL